MSHLSCSILLFYSRLKAGNCTFSTCGSTDYPFFEGEKANTNAGDFSLVFFTEAGILMVV